MSNEETKTIPLDEIHRRGWLMEANRQFFHPRGVSLTLIAVDKKDPAEPKTGLAEFLQWVRDNLESTDEAKADLDLWIRDMNRGFVGFLEDCRDDGGIEFGPSYSIDQSTARSLKISSMEEAVIKPVESSKIVTAIAKAAP